MKNFFTLGLGLIILSAGAQTQITNGGFETWDNAGTTTEEPTFFNSNKTGKDWAPNGPQTCFRETTSPHSGTYCARVETKTFTLAVVNGSLTTGIVNAPTTSKQDGYIGTIKNVDLSDIRRMSFTGRPDSLVGWYKYTQGSAAEKGKVVAYLHVGNFYDPQAATSYHPDSTSNKIATALFNTPTSNVTSWTRFAVAFNYVDGRTPSYIMINMTPSDNQLTNVAGSKIWLDDIAVVYPTATGVNSLAEQKQSVKVYAFEKNVYVDFLIRNDEMSTINVYDVTGKLVASQKVSNNRLNAINVFNLNSGMYLYQLVGSDFQKSGKFFVE